MDAPQTRHKPPAAATAGPAAAARQRPPPWRARLETALWRHGWAWPMALLLLAAAGLLEATQVQPLQQQLVQARAAERMAQAQAARVKAAPPAIVQRDASATAQAALGQALGTLAADRDVHADVGLLLALGRRRGIELAQAQYQSSIDPQAGLQRLQINLPAQASYGQARAWLQDLLLALPQTSIDQFELKRPSRSDAELAMTVKLSLWRLAAAPGGPRP